MGVDLKALIAVALFLVGPLVSLLIYLAPKAWKQRLLRGPRALLKRLSAAWKRRAAAKHAAEAKPEPPAKPKPQPRPARSTPVLAQQKPARSGRRIGLPASAPAGVPRKQLEDRLAAVLDKAATVAHDARSSRITSRFSGALDVDVSRKARAALSELRKLTERPSQKMLSRVTQLEQVLAKIEEFVGQRQDPALLAKLCDADTIAIDCYQPILDFASAKRLRITWAQPVATIGRFDERAATGFIPTGLALLHLPEQFFDNMACWPSVAHEIGHHFLAVSPDLDGQLRAQFDLPPEPVGMQRMPLEFGGKGFRLDDLPRVLGGWFEEIFCDVFGTLMLGPSYLSAMIPLFGRPGAPRAIRGVNAHPDRPLYDHHPPRHLRFAISARVIQFAGMSKEAASLRAEWARLHGGEPDTFLLPTGTRLLELPTAPLLELAFALVDRLCREPLKALSGYRLSEVPGIDFGLRENAAAERVRSDLRNGRVPLTSHAREIVAGAVLAVRDQPEREAQLIELARLGIRGTISILDDAPDAYDSGFAEADAASVEELREAFLLHTILSPPPGLQRLGLAPRDHFLGRPAAQSSHAPAGAPRSSHGNGAAERTR